MKKNNPAFTVELLGLFILLIMVITVVTQVFVMSRSHSLEARQLTDAVILAEDVAEISSTGSGIDEITDRFMDLGLTAEVRSQFDGSQNWLVAFDADAFLVVIERSVTTSGNAGAGVYAEDIINIYEPDAADAMLVSKENPVKTEPVYTLVSGKYFKEGE